VNIEQKLMAMRNLVQVDIGKRGLRSDPEANLITACPDDFVNACRSVADTPQAILQIITGFLIPHAEPPAAETDGPLGAVFLARALLPLGIQVILQTDSFCAHALQVGLEECGVRSTVPVVSFAPGEPATCVGSTHLIALERCGPSHDLQSLQAQLGTDRDPRRCEEFLSKVPEDHQNRYHTMRGFDVTEMMSPAHVGFEAARKAAPHITTIGIGDGGNEIGMGKIPWDVIRRNIPGGGLIACRVPTDYLIVAGVSNWGAYALAAGVALLRGRPLGSAFFDVGREREILRVMVEKGPLVDGVTGKFSISVDGLTFEEYAEPLRRLAALH